MIKDVACCSRHWNLYPEQDLLTPVTRPWEINVPVLFLCSCPFPSSRSWAHILPHLPLPCNGIKAVPVANLECSCLSGTDRSNRSSHLWRSKIISSKGLCAVTGEENFLVYYDCVPDYIIFPEENDTWLSSGNKCVHLLVPSGFSVFLFVFC